MALVINTNLSSINIQRTLSSSASALSTAMTRLSSGVRVNSAKDDAAGLAIADRMNSQIRGMTVAVRNANDGISLTQTAEGALGSLTDSLQRMRDLAVQASSNAVVSASDRAKMDTEFKALNDELMRVVQNSEFNGKKILNGGLALGLSIQVGATTDTNSRISVTVSNMSQLLFPITLATLSPASQKIDSSLSAAIAKASNDVVNDPASPYYQLNIPANTAAKLANAAVVAAKKAFDAPTDMALAKVASTANANASIALASSSAATKAITATNFSNLLLSQEFTDGVNATDFAIQEINSSIVATDTAIQAKSVTDAAQASSLLITANQLAEEAKSNITENAQNVYVSVMNALTGDKIDNPAAIRDITGQIDMTIAGQDSVLNQAVNRAIKMGNDFGADREAQKILASLTVAKAVSNASYVEDPLKTASANETVKASFVSNNTLVLTISSAADSVAADYALSAIKHIDEAIAAIDTERSNLGSTQNRFTTTIANLQNNIENQTAAKSRIMDADFAVETANLSRAQILQQAGVAMLAQANQSSQNVLTLLR
jgi:flagellin